MSANTSTHRPRVVDLSETEPNRRRGGDLRAMLTPTAVGATSGFMGLAVMQPGERIGEHYHPYSEEFVYVVSGTLEVDLDGEPHPLRPDQGLLIPPYLRHRFRNTGGTEARMVFHLGPLAPRPELGHVDTEEESGDGPGHAPGHGGGSGPADGAGGGGSRNGSAKSSGNGARTRAPAGSAGRARNGSGTARTAGSSPPETPEPVQ